MMQIAISNMALAYIHVYRPNAITSIAYSLFISPDSSELSRPFRSDRQCIVNKQSG